MRAVRVGADRRVIGLAAPYVLVRQRLDPLPQQPLEGRLVEIAGTVEDHREAAEQPRIRPVRLGQGEQPVVDTHVVPRAVEVHMEATVFLHGPRACRARAGASIMRCGRLTAPLDCAAAAQYES